MEWLLLGGFALATVKVLVHRRHARRAILDRRATMTGHRPDTLRARLPR